MTASRAAEVEFSDQNKHVTIAVGETLLNAVQAAQLKVSNVCAGRGVCGKCRVIVESGSQNVSSIANLERMSLSDRDFEEGFRIACCAKILKAGHITVRIPPETLTETQQLLVAGIQPQVEVRPSLRKYHLKLPRASLTDFRADLERLVEILRMECGIPRLMAGYDALKELPEALRICDWEVTATVSDDGVIIWVEPGQSEDRLYGFAVDIGTTKLAGYLVDLDSGETLANAAMINPQVGIGGDVISRIAYASRGRRELFEMHNELVEAEQALSREFTVAINHSSSLRHPSKPLLILASEDAVVGEEIWEEEQLKKLSEDSNALLLGRGFVLLRDKLAETRGKKLRFVMEAQSFPEIEDIHPINSVTSATVSRATDIYIKKRAGWGTAVADRSTVLIGFNS